MKLANLTKRYTLDKIGQEKIFSIFLNIPEMDIYECSQTGNKIHNPLRKDANASLTFYYTTNGKLKMWDYGNSLYRGDCFDLVGMIYGLSPVNKLEFMKILEIIVHSWTGQSNLVIHPKVRNREFKVIEYDPREWNNSDLQYWEKYDLQNDPLIVPIDSIFVDGKATYYYKPKDPAYAYKLWIDNEKKYVKIYFPKRKKSSKLPRFITNNTNEIECILFLHNTDVTVITKSYKDMLVINRHCNLLYSPIKKCFITVKSIPLSSESTTLTEGQNEFIQQTSKTTIGLFDPDEEGIRCGERHNQKYGISPKFINYPGAKDISDYYNLKRKTETQQLLINLIES